jgi:hypothetical protein
MINGPETPVERDYEPVFDQPILPADHTPL